MAAFNLIYQRPVPPQVRRLERDDNGPHPRPRLIAEAQEAAERIARVVEGGAA
jgi:hypothetical protein